MGFLLKEALKTLCGASQWSYAVFWKIGCQNRDLLIWEESHYEAMTIPRSGLLNQFEILARDPFQTLFKKMIMDNQVYVVGEGIVGRSAFTGEHQWIFSSNFVSHTHSHEVSYELHNQFLAGMQTVAVVPVLPHGVVQLGSPFVIQENMGFLNEVKSLILQLGCVPEALLYDHYPTKVSTKEINSTSSVPSSLASRPVGQPYYPLMQQAQVSVLTSASTIQAPNLVQMSSKAQDNHGQWSSSLDPCVQPSQGDDLFDILGLGFKNKILNSNSHGLIDNELVATPQNMFMEASSFMDMHNAGTDHLLDAVVSKAQAVTKQSSEDNVSCSTTVTKISSSSVPNTFPTYGRGIGPDRAFGLCNSLVRPGYGKDDDPGSCSRTSSIYGSQISSWVEQGRNVKHDTSVSTVFSKKTGDTCKRTRKRLKPGENPRPRPKDRQMIQDRVKELREIVPYGAKCSIDALLERTIKHMLFLQSVTKHADKLKQTGEFKIASKEGGLLLRDNFDGGATWAFEVGSQSMVCPIIVEDLVSPRQMLVKMLCEERGVFLEVADMIKGLGLTILKGVMEARDDKIWAHFAVEADRDVTRMEVFMSLIRLLEQTRKGNASSADSMDSNNMIVHNSPPQVASILATGQTH